MRLGRLSISSRTLRGLAAASVGLVLLGTALAAYAWPQMAVKTGVKHIVAQTHGSLSESALRAMVARMPRADASIAQRHDPHFAKKPWGLTPGWETLDLQGPAHLGFDPNEPEEAKRINAMLPSFVGAAEASKPFALPPGPDRARAQRCLTQAVYYEAATEPREGQEGVAQVILNRVRGGHGFANSVCGVVFQGCEFSFICDGSMARAPVAWAWKKAEEVATDALSGHVAAQVGTATHYHADYVMPNWAGNRLKLVQIGRHIFYRWRGMAGEPQAFNQRYAGREPVIDESRYMVNRFGGGAAAGSGMAELKANTQVIKTESGATRVTTIIGGPMAGRRKPVKDEISKINASLAKYEQDLGKPEAKSAPAVVAPKAAEPAAAAPH
jgi:spore germination cell wall hydrolase CwlJ-like protein